MARDNGGIIGPANNPTSDSASGVWDLPAQYQAISGGNWPPIPSIAANSLRFNSGSSDYLNRTIGTPTSGNTWTWSNWIKRSNISFGTWQYLFGYNVGGSNYGLQFGASTADSYPDSAYLFGTTLGRFNTDARYRDCSAWYHIVVSCNAGTATAYVNGESVVSGITMPSFASGASFRIGSFDGSSYYVNGYMSEVIFIDGQALDPTSFGQFNANGIWTPIPIGISSYGTNGFRLKFENSASLGLDSSPNGNNFTVNNLTSIDQVTDTPTNNFATLNPLSQGVTTTNRAYSNGNLSVTYNNGDDSSLTTMGVSTGKWYAEFKVTAQPTTATVGVGNEQSTFVVDPGNCNIGASTGAYGYFSTGQKRINGGGLTSYGSSYTTNDIIGIALNLDIGAIWFSKNGTWQASATITEIQNGTTTNAAATGLSGTFFLGTSNSASGTTGVAFDNNFGNPPFTIASGNSDGNGYGNFEYTVPSGYYALCTKNLAEFG
jgi:hypothetical protein